MLNEDFFKNMELGDRYDAIIVNKKFVIGEKTSPDDYIDFAWKGSISELGDKKAVLDAIYNGVKDLLENTLDIEVLNLIEKYFQNDDIAMDRMETMIFDDLNFSFENFYSKMWANGQIDFQVGMRYKDDIYYVDVDLTAREMELVARQMIKNYEKELDVDEPYAEVYKAFRNNYESIINEKYCSEMDEQRLENEEIER